MAFMDQLPDEDVSFAEVMRRPAMARALDRDGRAFLQSFVEGFNAADAPADLRARIEQADRGVRARAGRSPVPDARRLRRAPRVPGPPAAAHARRAPSVDGRHPRRVGRRRRRGRRARPVGRAAAAGPGARGADHRCRWACCRPARRRPAPSGFSPRCRPPSAGPSRAWRSATSSRWWRGSASRSGRGPFRKIAPATTFVHVPGAPVPTWWVAAPRPSTCLVGWTAGPAADRLHGRAPGAASTSRSAAWRAGWVCRARTVAAALEDARVFDWANDPFARGAYSWVPVGALDAPAALAVPGGGLPALRRRGDRRRRRSGHGARRAGDGRARGARHPPPPDCPS